jgi:UDP-N-acetylglucosamine 2-epimerase (non-hydrolysing)
MNKNTSSKKLKIMTVVGTRPEVIKLSRVIAELQNHVKHILVHTGQNHDYELNEIFFKQLKLNKPDYFLGIVGSTTAETIGNVIAKSDDIMAKEEPDALLLLGDTNSCLSAISAKRRKIPIFHMEAGNRCFDQTVPEEINRKIVDHISDINLPYTEHARRYLIAEGIRPETIIKTGSPMKEILVYYKSDIEASDILNQLKLHHAKYFVVSTHREENVDSDTNFHNLLYSLNKIAETYDMPVIVSTHPRTRKRLESLQLTFELDKRISFLKPLGFPDYVCLQTNAFCVVSDSGTITEESSIMNFPAVTIRQAHERPEGMDEGTLIMCGLQSERILQSIEVVTKQFDRNTRTFRLVEDYKSDNISKKVVRIIISYIDYVNRNVWHRYT